MRTSNILLGIQAATLVIAVPPKPAPSLYPHIEALYDITPESKPRPPQLPFSCGKCPKNHHCLMIPNGYETCVWEGYHTRELCIDSGEKLWKRNKDDTNATAVELANLDKDSKTDKLSSELAEKTTNLQRSSETINCHGKYDVCAEIMPSDGSRKGYCIERPFWMQWDACRNYNMGVKYNALGKFGQLIDSMIGKAMYGNEFDPCDYEHY